MYIQVSLFKSFHVCVFLHEWVCDVQSLGWQTNPPVYGCMRIYVHLSLCITQRSSRPLIHKHKHTNIHTHKQLELNEAELSLVPISLIINNFSLPPNTLINLQRRLCVRVWQRMRVGYVCLFVPASAYALWLIRDVVGNDIRVCVHVCTYDRLYVTAVTWKHQTPIKMQSSWLLY